MTDKILVLAANPQDTVQLLLNREIWEIDNALESGTYREQFSFRSKVAFRVDDLQSSLQKEAARIVHFCGHGMGTQGLVLETSSGQQQLLDTQAIVDLFGLFKNQIECVVLNACYSQVQAAEINQHINYVIGTKREIRDDAAIAFSKGFYEALGNGYNIEQAYEFGRNRIQLEIYGSSAPERKLVPVYSADEGQYIELPEHEVIELLVKEPLNQIENQALIQFQASGGNVTRIINIQGGNYNENIAGNYYQQYREAVLQREFIAKSPYKGLKRFNAKDKDLFFGRDRLISKLIQAVDQSNFVLVLGASGSGKSSVVRAGVIPQYESLSDTDCYSFLLTPNRDPFVTFHRSLLTHVEDIFTDEEVKFVLERKSDTLTRIVQLFKSKHLPSQCLIFIDQFEELFTLCSDLEIRSKFIQGLINLTQDRDKSIKLILAMRSDFLEELATYPQFARIAEKNLHLVADMEEGELRQAIEEPAAKQGIVFEAGLLEEIIKDVQGQAGSLPLLQYTLDLLWQNDDLSDRELNISTYHELGGVMGALQKHVNQIYEELPEIQQLATKQILLRLVDVIAFEQSEVVRTAVSKRAYKSEFTDNLAETVQLLVNKNLLVSDDLKQEGQSTVEIAHEALLSSWTELKEWISDARNTISLNSRLTEDAARWQELIRENSPKANDELWGGSKLEKVIELRRNGTFKVVLGGLSDPVNEFIDTSINWRDKEQKEKVRLQRRAIKFLSGGLAVAASFAVATGFLGIRSFFNNQEAQLEKRAANIKVKLSLDNQLEHLLESLELAGDNQKFNQSWFNRSTNLLPEAKSVLYQAVEEIREKAVFNGHQSGVNSVGFSPDGNYLVSGSSDNTLKLWSVKDQELVHTFKDHQSGVNFVGFSPDGDYIVSGSSDNTLKLWSVKDQELVHTFKDHQFPVWSVGFSPDGNYLVSGSSDNTLKLWSIKDQKLVHSFYNHQDTVWSVSFSPDGNYLVSASSDNTLKLWSVAKQELVHTFNGHQDTVSSVNFSPDGNYLVSASWDNTVKLWSVAKQELVHTFNGHQDTVSSVNFSPDGNYLVSGSQDNTVKLWSVKDQELVHTFNGHQDTVSSVNFGPDGNYLVSASWDNIVKLWSVEDQKLVHTFNGHQDTVNDLGVSQDGNYLVSASWDNIVKLWSVKDQELVHTFNGHQDRVSSVNFSQDGDYIVSGSSDNTLKLWSIKDQELVHTFNGHQSAVNDLGVSPNGDYIVSGSSDNTLKLWSVKDQELVHTFNGHQDRVSSVDFSQDGNYIVSGSQDNTVKLWSVEDQKLIHTFNGHQKEVSSVNFSPDGDYIVSASWDNTVKLWRGIVWQDWVQETCKDLRLHSDLVSNNIDSALGAANTCLDYGNWSKPETAQFLVKQGLGLAKSVDIKGAKRKIKQAAQLAPDNVNFPELETKVNQLAGEVLIAQSMDLAKNVDIKGAKRKLKQAAQLVPDNVNFLELETKVNQLAGEVLIAQSMDLAKNVDIKGAKRKLKQAAQLAPDNVNFPELETKVNQLAAQSLLDRGKEQVRQDNVSEAISLYEKTQALVPNLKIDPESWNSLCWFGSLNRYASEVLFACHQAVGLALDKSSKASYRDSRGLALALTRKPEAAIKDFQYYIDNANATQELKTKRRKWIEALNKGEDPFSDKVLEELKTE